MSPRLLQRARNALLGLGQLLAPLAVNAQMDLSNRLVKNLNYGKDLGVAACVVIFTALLIYAGVEVAARHKRVLDVWPILVGAAIAGSAGVAAAFLVS